MNCAKMFYTIWCQIENDKTSGMLTALKILIVSRISRYHQYIPIGDTFHQNAVWVNITFGYHWVKMDLRQKYQLVIPFSGPLSGHCFTTWITLKFMSKEVTKKYPRGNYIFKNIFFLKTKVSLMGQRVAFEIWKKNYFEGFIFSCLINMAICLEKYDSKQIVLRSKWIV